MTDALEIRLLGPFEVIAEGRPVTVSGSKRNALLALLALRRGRVVTVDALIEALWGDDLPSAPRNALQHHVARLRAALGPEAITASTDGYAVMKAEVDALRFEELLEEARAALREGDAREGAAATVLALGLWRGAPLHGLIDTLWFSAEAQRLEALRVDALEEQFDAALALGEHREIISPVRTALEESPFRERLWGQLMLALYRSGRQADALETFQQARRVLSEQLALEPGPDLRRLQEAILVQDPAIAAVEVPPPRHGNLPASSTSFVDREHELAQAVELLAAHRLVTLTGLPGVGKSRLALETVRSLESTTRDGAWLIDLARAGSEADVVRVLAQAIDARGADLLTRVTARLRDTDAVLLFDACEHVTREAGRVASAVLADCPGVRILATSREVLRVDGEVRIALDPLTLPEADSDADSPAVDLFVARARAARPGFTLTAEDAPIVAEISRQVDGLPLAIELAAARVNVLGLAELLSLVERRLTLLGARPESDAERAALSTLVEWSYDLLHADEKTLLHEIAVHRGGASLPSLVALGATHGLDEATVTYLLGALVDKSVISVSFPAEARYNLLDTVREYALEQLDESDGLAAARRAHAEYFATLAEEAHAGLRGPEWLAWTKRLQSENDNFWAALEYAQGAPDPGIAIQLGISLAWYFLLGERVSEGRRFLELSLAAAAGDTPLEQQLELAASLVYVAAEERDLEAAIELGERMLALAAKGPRPRRLGLVQGALGLTYAEAGDGARAAALAEEGYANVEADGDGWGMASGALLRAMVAAGAHDLSTAAEAARAAYRQAEAIGFDAFQVPAVVIEAWVAEQRGDTEAAAAAYRRALELANQTGFADHAFFALAKLGSCALAAGEAQRAEELFRRALAAAEAGHEQWVAAYARVELGRIVAADGDLEAAERMYRNVVDWSKTPRSHQPRESLFFVLAGDPADAAAAALGELGEPAATPAT